MARFVVDEISRARAQKWLQAHPELAHLRLQSRSDLLTLCSGPEDDASKHARIRRVGVGLWALEVSTQRGRWEGTLDRGALEATLDALTGYPWLLAPRD